MTAARPKRRWYQFSLRTLLLAVLVINLPLSWFAARLEKARKQKEAVEALEKAGGYAFYRSQSEDRFAELLAPKRARALLGDHFFFDVVAVLAYDKSIDFKLVTCRNLGDKELTYLKGLPSLEILHLGDTQVTDAGLENVKELADLRELVLSDTQVTDAGLEHLKGLTNLTDLHLGDTQITDAGLEHLAAMTNLTFLTLFVTQVTPEGVKKLQEALPDCEIVY